MLEISWNRMDWNIVGNENVEQLIWDLPRVLCLNWHLSCTKYLEFKEEKVWVTRLATYYNYLKKGRLARTEEVNYVPYRPVWSVYTVLVSALVQVHPLFRTGKNTGRAGRTCKIRLFWPVKMFRTGTNKKKKEKEKEEEDEKKWERERKR